MVVGKCEGAASLQLHIAVHYIIANGSTSALADIKGSFKKRIAINIIANKLKIVAIAVKSHHIYSVNLYIVLFGSDTIRSS